MSLLDTVSTYYLSKGVAVGVGEVEEATVKELQETKRELRGMIVALSDSKEENHKLRLRIAKLEQHDGAPATAPQPSS
jgi:hypothetical protein